MVQRAAGRIRGAIDLLHREGLVFDLRSGTAMCVLGGSESEDRVGAALVNFA